MSNRLLSNYNSVQLHSLREAGMLRGKRPSGALSTYRLTYFVQYTTMCSELKFHSGLHHEWNVDRNGEPTPANLRKWIAQHEFYAAAAGAELLVVQAELLACGDRQQVCEVIQ